MWHETMQLIDFDLCHVTILFAKLQYILHFFQKRLNSERKFSNQRTTCNIGQEWFAIIKCLPKKIENPTKVQNEHFKGVGSDNFFIY